MAFKPVGVDENSKFPVRVENRLFTKVAEMIAASVSIPPGGTDGQILTKLSPADGDAGWMDAPSSAGNVTSVNGQTGVVELDAQDVDAAPAVHSHPMTQITDLVATLASKVSTTLTIAGKPLTSNITLAKADVGLANVDNTSDLAKPISTAVQSGLDLKVPSSRMINGNALTANVTLVKADVGLGNVDNTADVDKPVSTATTTALAGKAATSHTHSAVDINTGTLSVNRGGTGRNSNFVHQLLAGGATVSGAIQNVASGTAGQFLKSAGTSALPLFASFLAADISDSGAIGRNVVKAATVTTAMDAIGVKFDPTGTLDPTGLPNNTLIVRHEA